MNYSHEILTCSSYIISKLLFKCHEQKVSYSSLHCSLKNPCFNINLICTIYINSQTLMTQLRVVCELGNFHISSHHKCKYNTDSVAL